MKDGNPYTSASSTSTGNGAEPPRPSWLQVIALLFALTVFGLLFLFAASGVYFTINPAVLQAGNQPVPASFQSDDYLMLVVWSMAAATFAVALAWCAARIVSALRRLLG